MRSTHRLAALALLTVSSLGACTAAQPQPGAAQATRAELAALDGQIARYDSLIARARAHIKDPARSRDANAEIASYEARRSALLAEKARLERQGK